LGINVLKPDRVICRIFSRLGLTNDESDIVHAVDIGRKIALATGYPIRYVDLIFVKYGQMGKDEYFGLEDGICVKKNPKCQKCGVSNYCEYYTASQR
jgi:DNA-3-methyladenine glycosylase I